MIPMVTDPFGASHVIPTAVRTLQPCAQFISGLRSSSSEGTPRVRQGQSVLYCPLHPGSRPLLAMSDLRQTGQDQARQGCESALPEGRFECGQSVGFFVETRFPQTFQMTAAISALTINAALIWHGKPSRRHCPRSVYQNIWLVSP
jgi:hypothetical protein